MSKLTGELGRKIKIARIAAGLSQGELAEKVDLTDRAISSYEKGRNIPPVDKLEKIAQKTHHPLRFFIEDPDPMLSIQTLLKKVEYHLDEVKELFEKQKNTPKRKYL